MTEYIITEEELENIQDGDLADLKAVRSHPYNPQAGDCHYCNRCIEAERKHERDKVLDELIEPMKEMLKAIGGVYKIQMALPGDYNCELGEAIQVCFDAFIALDGKIAEQLRSTKGGEQG